VKKIDIRYQMSGKTRTKKKIEEQMSDFSKYKDKSMKEKRDKDKNSEKIKRDRHILLHIQ